MYRNNNTVSSNATIYIILGVCCYSNNIITMYNMQTRLYALGYLRDCSTKSHLKKYPSTYCSRSASVYRLFVSVVKTTVIE